MIKLNAKIFLSTNLFNSRDPPIISIIYSQTNSCPAPQFPSRAVRSREKSREKKRKKEQKKKKKIRGEQDYFTIATEEQSSIPLLLSARNSRKKVRKWQALSVPRESLPSDACITVYCRSPRGRVLGITSFLSAFATATFLPSGYASRCSSLPDKMDLLLFDFPPSSFSRRSRIKNESFFFLLFPLLILKNPIFYRHLRSFLPTSLLLFPTYNEELSSLQLLIIRVTSMMEKKHYSPLQSLRPNDRKLSSKAKSVSLERAT